MPSSLFEHDMVFREAKEGIISCLEQKSRPRRLARLPGVSHSAGRAVPVRSLGTPSLAEWRRGPLDLVSENQFFHLSK